MTLKELIREELGSFDQVTIDRDAKDHGRPGTRIELRSGCRAHAWFFASDNKMTAEHMVTVMKKAIR